jgi:predicted metal-dependent enzyme (double-stranded beta helix superfamily)
VVAVVESPVHERESRPWPDLRLLELLRELSGGRRLPSELDAAARETRARLAWTIDHELPERHARASDAADLDAMAIALHHCDLVTCDAFMADVIRRTRLDLRHAAELFTGRRADVLRLRDRLRAAAVDEYVLDTPRVRDFIGAVRAAVAAAASPEDACDAIRPRFAELLADPDWLPRRFQEPAPESGMGGGIGQWLLFRAADRSLSLFSLVVPPGSSTPIHDHLAWGLVGLYRGTQDEEIYAERDGRVEPAERRALARGDFYVLLPPRDDVHRVRTTSPETSVSIHLLTNDTGCVWRHRYDERSGMPAPFRSGYVNVACEDG